VLNFGKGRAFSERARLLRISEQLGSTLKKVLTGDDSLIEYKHELMREYKVFACL
jgi:hypothetical protein